MDNAIFLFNQGLNTADASEALQPGELEQAVGVYYKRGDSDRLWKIPGRTEFGDTGIEHTIAGVVLAKFDPGGTDRLLAYVSGIVFSATPGETGTFGAQYSGLSSSATNFDAVHYNNRWYLWNGVDGNLVLEDDGSLISHGLTSPQTAPLVSGAGATSTLRPTSVTAPNWSNPANIYDSNADTFGNISLSGHATNEVLLTGFSSNTTPGRFLSVRYRLAGLQPFVKPIEDNVGGGGFGAGGTFAGGFNVTLAISYSTDGGSTYNTLAGPITTHKPMTQVQVAQIALPDAINTSNLAIKGLFTYNAGVGNNTASFQFYDARVDVPAVGAGDVVIENGVYYITTEFDASRGLESAPGPASLLTTASGISRFVVTTPDAPQNVTTTHYRFYRTFDNADASLELFGRVGEVPVTETSFVDLFDVPVTDVAYPPLSLVAIQANNGEVSFPKDGKAPAFKHITSYKGCLVGISVTDSRVLRYSAPGAPFSFPEPYVIQGFPMNENDNLIATATVGDNLVVFAEDSVMTLQGLPLDVDGRFESGPVSLMKGQPGLVGPRAFTDISIVGEARVAWVSKFGIHWTDGSNAFVLTDDLDWVSGDDMPDQETLSSSVLLFDKQKHLLFFSYDSDGDGRNDRYLTLALNPQNMKQNQLPRITGPHWGSLADLTAGSVDGVFRVYSGGNNGKVYLEWNGTSDASNSYNSNGSVPSIVRTKRQYAEYEFWTILRANLRTTDFGSNETATITHTYGKDNPARTFTRDHIVNLGGNHGKEFSTLRTAEWHQFTITHTGTGTGAFKDLRAKVETDGDAGTL